MGWFDRWRKATRDTHISREALFDAASGSDPAALEKLCSEHGEWIIGQFKTWTKIPAEIRGDRRALDAYANSMIAIAQLFAAKGNPALLQMMIPTGQRNPLDRWPAELASARQLLASGEALEACSRTKQVIAEIQTCTGTGAEEYLPKAWGVLGEIYFYTRDLDGAQHANECALDLCRQNGDAEGVGAYSANLGEVARARGDLVAATSWFQEAIAVLESAGLGSKAEELRSRLPAQGGVPS